MKLFAINIHIEAQRADLGFKVGNGKTFWFLSDYQDAKRLIDAAKRNDAIITKQYAGGWTQYQIES